MPHDELRQSQPDSPAILDPLDSLAAVQPSDLVPLSTGDAETFAPPLTVGDIPAHADEEPSLEEYVQRIEASAARLRAEQSGDGPVQTDGDQSGSGGIAGDQARQPTVPVRTAGRRRTRKAVTPPKPWYRRRRTWFIGAMVIPLLFVAAATAYVLNIVRLSVDAYDKIHEDPIEDRIRYTVNEEGTAVPVPSAEIEAVLPDWENDEPINIVLLGVDTRVGDDQPPRSDTTIVVHIDPATEEVAMMSIPRDLLVYIPGFGEDKFNAAYPIGEANEEEIPGGGSTLVAQTVEANFNIPVHYFATIDFEGFKEVVDTVGGVVVDVETELTDNLYPTDDLRLTRVYFPAGLQKMDGETALQYVRTRHADSDLGRSERQQQVLMAIREQAVSLDLITRAQSLIQDMKETIRTDLNFNEMLALANLGRNVQPDDIARLNLWEEGLLTEHLPEFDGDAYYLAANWDAVLVETRAFFGAPAPTSGNAASVDVETPDFALPIVVENATSVPLLAGTCAEILEGAGFADVSSGDADAPQRRSTIETDVMEMATAQHVAELLGLPDTSITTVNGNAGITVTLGDDVPDDLLPGPAQESAAG